MKKSDEAGKHGKLLPKSSTAFGKMEQCSCDKITKDPISNFKRSAIAGPFFKIAKKEVIGKVSSKAIESIIICGKCIYGSLLLAGNIIMSAIDRIMDTMEMHMKATTMIAGFIYIYTNGDLVEKVLMGIVRLPVDIAGSVTNSLVSPFSDERGFPFRTLIAVTGIIVYLLFRKGKDSCKTFYRNRRYPFK